MEKMIPCKWNQKKASVAILTTDKIDFKINTVIRDKEGHYMEKEMATHSSILAWRLPGTEEPGGLPSMGSHRVRHD